MATWRTKLLGLKALNTDKSIFPDLSIEEVYVIFESRFVIALDQEAKQIAAEENKSFCDFLVIDIQRTDKKTKTNYNHYIDFKGQYGYKKNELFYKLNDLQVKELSLIKHKIYSKLATKENQGRSRIYNTYFDHIYTDAAVIRNSIGELIDHSNASILVKSVRRFYSNINKVELIILNSDSGQVTLEEVEAIKFYTGERTEGGIWNNVEQDDLLWFEKDELNVLLQQNPSLNIDLLKSLLEWISANENNKQVIKKLEVINIDDINKINLIIGISALRNILEIWDYSKDEHKEEYWQQILQNNSIILSQLFSYPVVLTKGKAYVGGKYMNNSNGKIVDFLLSNKLTKNSVLVEIKTPVIDLVSNKYREGIFNISQELTGAIIQVSMYKDSLLKDFKHLVYDSPIDFEVFNPACLVIAGNFEREALDKDQRKSFELFRSGLKDVQIITYDELFEKVRILLDLFEGR